MRLPTTCGLCADERLRRIEAGEPTADGDQQLYLADLNDDGAYVLTCDFGHEIRFALQNLRYELLYESGIVAMLCGFHRETVASIASALERFFEFVTHAILAHRSVDDEPSRAAWKEVASQSERQVGAFLYLYLAEFKRAFTTPNGRRPYKKLSEFRNDVIHKGHIPSRTQTEEYARDVYEIVRAVRADLETLGSDAVSRIERQMGSGVGWELLQEMPPIGPDPEGLWHHGGTINYNMMLSSMDTNARMTSHRGWRLRRCGCRYGDSAACFATTKHDRFGCWPGLTRDRARIIVRRSLPTRRRSCDLSGRSRSERNQARRFKRSGSRRTRRRSSEH
jgi:hypothetical protein